MNAIEDEANSRTIDDLLRIRENHLVSIYLTTHPASPEGQQDASRLKNLLHEAKTSLIDRGLSPEDARRILKPAMDLADDDSFWQGRRRGLAFFLGREVFRILRLRYEFEQEVVVDDRFHIRQLLPLIGSEGSAVVLAISQNGLRLLSVSPSGYRKLEGAGLPRNMEEALDNEDVDRGEQVHAGGAPGPGSRKRSAVFHGQGGRADSLKHDLEEYFRATVRALRAILQNQREPLVLAGPKYELPIFRDVCDLPQLVGAEIYGNFDRTSDHELHEKALPVVRDLLKSAQRRAEIRFERLADSDRTSSDVQGLLRAARKGHIETLFLDTHAKVRGAFDVDAERVQLGEGPDAGDLLDLLAAETLLHGGEVYAVEPNEMPVRGAVAGILRY